MAAHIPADMLPRMDWNAEDKQAVWTFFKERLGQYFVIAMTPEAVKVTHILFYSGKKVSERWTALKDQVDQTKLKDAETVFITFANSFEKSSSYWQARNEYLSDIKQTKHQTMAELDIYIKGLIRRCQFPQEEQETCKIDLLHHATAHFEIRKFVHNAKPEELKYDKMIEVAKAHERACQEYQIHKQAHSMAPPVTTPIFCYKQVLCRSLFRKTLPRKPVVSADAHLTMGNAQHMGLHVASMVSRTTGLSNVEAPGGGTVQLVTHPPWEGHNKTDNEDTVASNSTKAGDAEEATNSSSDPLPRSQAKVKDEEKIHTRLPPLQLLNSFQDQHTLPM